jgi:hypothetical protein
VSYRRASSVKWAYPQSDDDKTEESDTRTYTRVYLGSHAPKAKGRDIRVIHTLQNTHLFWRQRSRVLVSDMPLVWPLLSVSRIPIPSCPCRGACFPCIPVYIHLSCSCASHAERDSDRSAVTSKSTYCISTLESYIDYRVKADDVIDQQ